MARHGERLLRWLSASALLAGCASTSVATTMDAPAQDIARAFSGDVADTPPLDASDEVAQDVSSALDARPVVVSAGFDVQGHRGARGLRPENTLPSFERALALGVDTLETDLHFSSDDALIVWHDPTVGERHCRIDPSAAPPLPPEPRTRPRIRTLTAAQLRKYRCDQNLDGRAEQRAEAELVAGDDYRLLELSEVFDFVGRYSSDARVPAPLRARAARVRFNLETKRSIEDPSTIGDGFDGSAPGAFERALVALVRARGLEDRVTVQSFDERSLRAVRTLSPTITLSMLTLGLETPDSVRATGATIWAPSGGFVTRSAVTVAHRAGLRVIPWTVNDAAQFRALLAHGIDGVITDRPDVLLAEITR
jgi:glycerophosphoryl diester phosphodiesterase